MLRRASSAPVSSKSKKGSSSNCFKSRIDANLNRLRSRSKLKAGTQWPNVSKMKIKGGSRL
jgi:hypothetical protein